MHSAMTMATPALAAVAASAAHSAPRSQLRAARAPSSGASAPRALQAQQGRAQVVRVQAGIVPTTFVVKQATAPAPATTPTWNLEFNPMHEPEPASSRIPFMAGNWKMNPATLKEATALASLLAANARTLARDKPELNVDVAVFPPSVFLPAVMEILKGSSVKVGAQDVHFEAKGAFTGALTTSMVKSLGCEYVLVGHSERRAVFGDTNRDINKKVRAVLDAGLKPILCIGETKGEYEAGLVKVVCADQLGEALAGVTAKEMVEMVTIAYEPVWAIGTGLTATPAIAQSTHAYVRSWLASTYDSTVAKAVRIQYGGSVTPETVDAIMQAPDVDGCLVGGASLLADKFSRIWNPMPSAPRTARTLWAEEALPCGNVLGESPVWSEVTQKLYWVSSMGQELWEWDLVSDPRSWKFDEVVGCCCLSESGDLVLGLERGLCYFNLATGEISVITPFEEGLNTRPNDGRVDKAGNFVVGSYNNNHRGDGQDIAGLYRLSAETKELTEILGYRFRCSNCICFSPDGATMFFCDTPTRRIFTFDYSPEGGLSNRRFLYEMPSDLEGGPDGAQCDAQGYLWATLSGAGKVLRISPTGVVDTVVELPVKSPTSCTIGGPDLDTLFITTRGPDGGGLYTVKLPADVQGQVEPEFADVAGGVPTAFGTGAAPGQFCEMCGTKFRYGSTARFCSACGCKR